MGVLFFPKVETNNLWLCAYSLIFLHYLSSDRIIAMKKKEICTSRRGCPRPDYSVVRILKCVWTWKKIIGLDEFCMN